MTLETRTIHASRALLTWLIRATAVAMIAVGLYWIGARLVFALLGNGDLISAFKVWSGVGSEHGIFRGLPLTLIGAVLATASRRIARWVITVPESGCPSCAYARPSDAAGPCPECAYGSEPARQPDPTPDPITEPKPARR